MFKVECNFVSGWGDAEWEIEGEPMRFKTREDAQAEIDIFIKDGDEAVEEGFMVDKCNKEDYRVSEVK